MANTDPIIEKIEQDSGGSLLIEVPAPDPATGEYEFDENGQSVFNDTIDTSVQARLGLDNIFTLITVPIVPVATSTVLPRGKSAAMITSTSILTLTLPQADEGVEVTVKNTLNSTVNVTVETTGSADIDGNTNDSISTSYEFKRYICDGSNWFIV